MRYFLIDRITRITPGESAEGIKCVSLADDVFADHFPGHPIMPGALLLEAMAQLGGVLAEATMRDRGRHDLHALLSMVDRAKFRVMVRPGDKVVLEAVAGTVRDEGAQVKGLAKVDGKLCAEAEMVFVFATVTNPVVLARRKEILNIWLTGSAETP